MSCPEMISALALTERLYDDEETDVKFELSDGTVSAHRLVLRAASDVFRAMFAQSMFEERGRVIPLPDVTSVEMRVFLRLLYTGGPNY